jgi:hypothetical protein
MLDWPGLLKWSLAQKDNTTVDPNLKPLDQKTREWLQEALESYSFNEAKRMQEIVKELNQPEPENNEKEEERRLVLTEELSDLIEGLESARDLVRMGIYAPLMNVMFNSKYADVRKTLYFVFASCNSINTFVQNASMENDGFNLLNSVMKEETNENKEAAFAALTSLVRGEAFNIKRRFIDIEGIEFLLELLSNDKVYKSAKIRTKVMTLLQDLVFYDDKLHFVDIVAFNKVEDLLQKKVNNKNTQHISLNKEESKSNQKKEEAGSSTPDLSKYKNIVKAKLIEKGFVDIAMKHVNESNISAYTVYQSAFFSILMTLIQESKYKLSKEHFERLEKFFDHLKTESQKENEKYDPEVDVLKSLLSLKN